MIAAALLAAALAAPGALPAFSAPAVPDAPPVADEASVGPYVVRVLGSDDEAQGCRVTRDGATVLETPPGFRMRIGRLWGVTDYSVVPGTDVNADGVPDVTLWDWSGGAHCCFTVTVLSLGDSARVLAELPTRDAGARFTNLDDDPALEVETAEHVFAYWPGSFASSAAPRVALDWEGERLVSSAALTHRAVDADSALAVARTLRLELDWSDSGLHAERAAEVFRGVLELFYAGHPSLGLEYLSLAWPDGLGAYRDRLLVELGMRLRASPYWERLAPAGDEAWR